MKIMKWQMSLQLFEKSFQNINCRSFFPMCFCSIKNQEMTLRNFPQLASYLHLQSHGRRCAACGRPCQLPPRRPRWCRSPPPLRWPPTPRPLRYLFCGGRCGGCFLEVRAKRVVQKKMLYTHIALVWISEFAWVF